MSVPNFIFPVAVDDGLLGLLPAVKGPEFLLLFVGWFFLTFLTVLILRRRGHDTPFATLGGLICFEVPGLLRIIEGSSHGMHKWTFLILTMIFGGIVFLIRAENFSRSGGSGGCGGGACSGGSSGCGGGGGGGCGGCGGS